MVTRLGTGDPEIERIALDKDVRRTLDILADVFGPAQQRTFAVRLWNGMEERGAEDVEPRFVLVLNRPDSLRRMLLPATERRVAEAFLGKDVDVEGDLEAATALGETLADRQRSMLTALRLIRRLSALPAGKTAPGGLARHRIGRWLRGKHSRARDVAAVRHHYDVGNDFYSLWLDDRMVYSCGYFPTGRENLNAAQEAKLELICRKLRLQPGDRLLDIGCGWGGLIIYAVERYGVRATGITLSHAQAELARTRIADAGMTDQCRVEILDYRDLPTGIEFDKIASVGMVEHVGHAKLPAYFRSAYRVLRPGGLFLNHGIVALAPTAARLVRGVLQGRRRPQRRAQRRRSSFIQQYVFPDSELLSPAENLAPAEAVGFETRDVENLREHYAHTLRCWLRRLDASQDEAIARVGEPAYRIWRLCLAGSARAFAAGRIGVIQTLLAKRRADGTADVPRTRANIYAS